jgi:N-acetylmuramoyl-L-alanine amidase
VPGLNGACASWRRAAAVCVVFATGVCLYAAATSSKVTNVRFWSLGEVTRVAIEVSSDFHYTSDRIDGPERLFFDIHGASPEMARKGMYVIPVGDPLLKQIRVAETQPGVTRVVLDLEQRVEFTASQLSKPDRLMIELRVKDRPSPPATTSVSGVKSLLDPPVRAVEADLESTGISSPAAASPSTPPSPFTSPSPFTTPSMNSPANSPATREAMKPAPRRFEPPAPQTREIRTDPKPDLLPQPTLALATRSPYLPVPPASMRMTVPAVPAPAPNSSSNASNSASPSQTGPPAPGANVRMADASLRTPAPIAESAPAPTASLIPSAPAPAAPPQAAKMNTIGDRSLTRVLGLKLGRVVLDPGHGGHDIGTHGPSGLAEKDIVLDVSKRLGALLEQRLGSEVIYTRSDDTYVGLEDRTRFANDHKADLFLSIHVNSSPYRTVDGVETYYLNFTTSKAALDLAARENASSQRSVFDLKDLLQKIALRDKIDESREFATRVQTSLYTLTAKSSAEAKNRGVKKAPFVVLIGASMPSVLAEIGFLSNSADEALLRRPDHRERIAEALYKGIASYADTLSHFQVARRN